MKRSANGTGTIYKRKGVSKPYCVYGKAYLEDGVMKREYLGSFATRKQAEERRAAYVVNPEIRKSDLTFETIFREFCISERYKQLSDSAKDCYKAAFKHCAQLYSVRFSDIRTANMQQLVNSLAEKGMSESSVQKVKILFSVMYSYAMQNDIVGKNYAEFIVMPKFARSEKRALTDLEIEKIAKAAAKGNQTAQWTYFLIFSGWRIGEFLELTSFSYNEEEKAFTGGKKTDNGRNRVVPVHPELEWIVENQLAKNGQTVFCMKNGKPMTTNYFRKSLFAPLLKELGIDETITPHITRHTFATKLKRAKADEFYRKKLLGHSSNNVTDDVYTHADIENLRKTIALLKVNPVCSLYAIERKTG